MRASGRSSLLLEYLEHNRVELYNLRDDPSEKSDLASAHADRASALRERLQTWRQEVGARLPIVYPDFRRAP